MTKTRRWLSLLVAACLTLSLFPAGALAEENAEESDNNTTAINLGASVIEENDTIYFGTNSGSAVSWSVLSTSGNGDTYKDSAGVDYSGSALFLLSDSAWYTTAFGSGNTYTNSTLQQSLLNAAKSTNYFSAVEQTAILKTTKAAPSDATALNEYTYDNPGLSDDTLFALSANELVEYLGYGDSSNWSVGAIGSIWWLRSAASVINPDIAGIVDGNGDPAGYTAYTSTVLARPAFNLNLNSVLFTSAAQDGKSSGDVGADALTAVSTDDYSAWKLTLKDSTRDDLEIGIATVSGSTLTLTYSGATIGAAEYISAIVVDENENITYYGRIKNTTGTEDASGTVQITLPDGFNSDTDTLYLFSEQYNGDKNTDYASKLQEVSIGDDQGGDNEGSSGEGGSGGDGSGGEGGFGSEGGNDASGITKSGWTRLAGDDRYETMVEVVKEAFGDDSSNYVVIASGQNFADSLTASSLAGVLDAPIILVSGSLTADTIAQIERVGASYAYIVGGTASVSASVATQIASIAGIENVERVSGADRYATAVAVAEKTASILADQGETLDTVILASGTVYADALSISPYAYTTATPIILVGSNGLLGDASLNWITSSDATSLIVAGGTASVANGAITQTGISSSNSERLAGNDRYETSVEIANWAIGNGDLSANGAVVASGATFPDALAASALCGQFESVLLLASDRSTVATSVISAYADSITYAYFVGGPASISATVANTFVSASNISLND